MLKIFKTGTFKQKLHNMLKALERGDVEADQAKYFVLKEVEKSKREMLKEIKETIEILPKYTIKREINTNIWSGEAGIIHTDLYRLIDKIEKRIK